MPRSPNTRNPMVHDVPHDESRSTASVAREQTTSAQTTELSLRALTSYYGAHYTELLGYAFTFVGNAQQAEDTVQQAFVNTIAAIENGTEVANLSAWLHRCIRNLAHEQRRHDPFLPLNEALEVNNPLSTADEVVLRESSDAVQRAVEALPEHLRAALLLAEVRGFTYKEIAAALDRSVHSVRQMIRRARRHVREIAGPESLPASSPLLGLRLSASDLGSPLRATRNWSVARWNDFQNWLTAIVSRLGETLAAPATSLVVAAVIAGGLSGQAPTVGGSLAGARLQEVTAELSPAHETPAEDPAPTTSREDGHTGQPPTAPRAEPPAAARDESRDERRDSDSQSGKTAGGTGTHTAKPSPQPAIDDPGSPPSEPEGGLVTRGYDGTMANNSSGQPVVSPGGNVVAYSSVATNIVPGDTNGAMDVFVDDLDAQARAPVSVSASGEPANGPSAEPAITSGGMVAFSSFASNLVANDTNGLNDVFVRDIQAGGATLVSEGAEHRPANGPSSTPTASANARFVAFASRATNLVGEIPETGDRHDAEAAQVEALPGPTATSNVFVRDLQAEAAVLVSTALFGKASDGESHSPSISASGRYIAFVSKATNLVADDHNGAADIFVFDQQSGVTERVSRAASGDDANGSSDQPKISADGRYVVFASTANNIDAEDTDSNSDVYAFDRVRNRTKLVSGPPDWAQVANGSCPANTTAVVRASLGDSGIAALKPTVGAHGQLIAFEAPIAANVIQRAGSPPTESQVFYRDMATGTTCLAIRDIENDRFRWPTRDPALSATENTLVFVGERTVSSPTGSLEYLGVFFRRLG